MIEENFSKEQNLEVKKSQELHIKETNNLYWYEMLHRPVDMGCQPKGFVETKDGQGQFGLVAYPRPLTEKELDQYEMRKWSQNVYLIDLTDIIKQSFTQMPLDKLKEHYEQKDIPDSDFIKAFNERNKERYFILSEDHLKEPMVLIKWSEHARLQSSELIPLSVANPLFKELNKTELQEDLGYYKTRYSVLLPDIEHGLDLISPDRHDLGDGYYVDILDQLKKDKVLNPDQEKTIQKFLHREQTMELTR